MSSEQTTQNGQMPASESFQNVLNDSDLEKLIPKNLSSNKRAVIERLVALHQQNAPLRR